MDGCKEGEGNSFIYSFRDDQNIVKLYCTDTEKEVYHSDDLLCCFGINDLIIKSNCNVAAGSYSNLGMSYELPDDIQMFTNESKTYLAGSYEFKVLEMEVFQLQI